MPCKDPTHTHTWPSRQSVQSGAATLEIFFCERICAYCPPDYANAHPSFAAATLRSHTRRHFMDTDVRKAKECVKGAEKGRGKIKTAVKEKMLMDAGVIGGGGETMEDEPPAPKTKHTSTPTSAVSEPPPGSKTVDKKDAIEVKTVNGVEVYKFKRKPASTSKTAVTDKLPPKPASTPAVAATVKPSAETPVPDKEKTVEVKTEKRIERFKFKSESPSPPNIALTEKLPPKPASTPKMAVTDKLPQKPASAPTAPMTASLPVKALRPDKANAIEVKTEKGVELPVLKHTAPPSRMKKRTFSTHFDVEDSSSSEDDTRKKVKREGKAIKKEVGAEEVSVKTEDM